MPLTQITLYPLYQGTLISYISNSSWSALRNDSTGSIDYSAAKVVSQASTTTGNWITLRRPFFAFDLNGQLPAQSQISGADFVCYIESSGFTYESGESNKRLNFCEFLPTSARTVVPTDFSISKFSYTTVDTQTIAGIVATDLNSDAGLFISLLATDSFNTIALRSSNALSSITPSTGLFGVGFALTPETTNYEPTWNADFNVNISIVTSSASTAKLILNYVTSETVDDTTRRRLGFPESLPTFQPLRTTTRWGAPITTLQEVRAKVNTEATRVQDFLCEMPPIIARNIAVSPNSAISATPNTVLLASGNKWPIWVKREGSGNTGWVGLMYKTDPFGSTS